MIGVELTVTKREQLGKGASKKFRRNGLVPAVIYGKNKKNLNIVVNLLKLKKIFKTEAGENAVIEMQVENSDIKKTVLLKEAHLDTLTDHPLHFDFYETSEGEKVKITCPLKFVGHPEGVKNGGIIQTLSNTIKVECLLGEIPNEIEVEISFLDIGDTLKVKDLPQLDRINITSNPNSTIISILTPRLITETEQTTAGEDSTEKETEGKFEEETTESDKKEAT